jgi:hypothetical protein
MTNLYVTLENGRTVNMGPQRPPHDTIATSRDLLQAMANVAYVEWRDPANGYIAFTATRVSAATFGWRSSSMAVHAYGELS